MEQADFRRAQLELEEAKGGGQGRPSMVPH
jgi:hypothetical protein